MKQNKLNLRKGILLICLAIFSLSGFAQRINVRGTITDTSGESLIGVTVQVQGTTIGTVTDADGNYTIPSIPTNAVLEVSYVGMNPQVIPVNGRTVIDIVMQEDSELLEEVVVIGYGTMRKSDVTGAVAVVSAEELTSKPVTNAFEALQGKVAGVDITSSQRPGELGSVRIRGNRSLNATNAPLYVVDGVVLSSGGIESINPREVGKLNWDEKLTLEINGNNPGVREMTLRSADLPTLFLAGNSTVTDQDHEPWCGWGQMLP